MKFILIIILALGFSLPCSIYSVPKQNSVLAPSITMNIPGYPLVFELNKGDSILIDRTFKNKRISKTLILKEVRPFSENNNWISASDGKRNYYKTEVDVLISGKSFTLVLRPYQMPVLVEGLRIYVEGVKIMDGSQKREVRFSVCLESEPWGQPSELEFPVNNYRWRSGSYFNTWSSLVPFNFLYYHRGEDLGVIPDRLDVRAWTDGQVINWPLPLGDNSNKILIRKPNGLEFDYYHCNLEYIDKDILIGKYIKKGQYIAKTGMTWNGEKSQHNDPHVHLGLNYNGNTISLFPYLIEAYFRKYDDK
ncbi:MAG: M23 family metallopeptidase, partial [Ignavibacteria bacterium]|nr:M23 family metallopeptidase [Ignavibacteria bacterium]